MLNLKRLSDDDIAQQSACKRRTPRKVPQILPYTIPKSNSDPLPWQQDLEKFGFAVVKAVWPKDEAAAIKDDLLKWQHTYTQQTPATHGIQLHPDVAHLPTVWRVREDERIAKVFQDIWKTDDLLVSFDRVNISIPKPNHSKGWLHLDQSKLKRGLWCVQGFLNCAPCGPNGGGLVVLQDSHKYFEDFCREHYDDMDTADWHKLTPSQITWFEQRGCKPVKVCCDEGDVVLWDSRTVHHAVFPSEDVTRTCVYVSMMPRALATVKDLANKRKALEQVRATSHWAACNVKLFPRENQHFGNPSNSIKHSFPCKITNIIDQPWFSARCKRLAGLI